MHGYGPRGHFLFAILAGAVWILCVAAAFAILFFIVRFAVLSAMKAHTTWAESRPVASGQAPAPAAVSAPAPVQLAPEAPAAPPKPPKPPKKG